MPVINFIEKEKNRAARHIRFIRVCITNIVKARGFNTRGIHLENEMEQ